MIQDEWDIICRTAIDRDPELGLVLTGCRVFARRRKQRVVTQPVATNNNIELLTAQAPQKILAETIIGEQVKEPLLITILGRAEHGPSACIPAQH